MALADCCCRCCLVMGLGFGAGTLACGLEIDLIFFSSVTWERLDDEEEDEEEEEEEGEERRCNDPSPTETSVARVLVLSCLSVAGDDDLVKDFSKQKVVLMKIPEFERVVWLLLFVLLWLLFPFQIQLHLQTQTIHVH